MVTTAVRSCCVLFVRFEWKNNSGGFTGGLSAGHNAKPKEKNNKKQSPTYTYAPINPHVHIEVLWILLIKSSRRSWINELQQQSWEQYQSLIIWSIKTNLILHDCRLPRQVLNTLVNDMLVNSLRCHWSAAPHQMSFKPNLNLMGFSQLSSCFRAQLSKGLRRVEG